MKGLLLTLCVFALIAGPASAAASPIRVEKIRGSVHVIAGKSKRALRSEAELRVGDTLETGRTGSVARVVFAKGRIDLAPWTRVQLRRDGVTLLRGHIRAEGAGGFKVTAGNTAAWIVGESGEFLVHRTAEEQEFTRRLSGTLDEPTTAPALPSKKDGGFVQIGSLGGSIAAQPLRSERLVLKAGEITRVRFDRGDFAPVQVGLEEVKRVRDLLWNP